MLWEVLPGYETDALCDFFHALQIHAPTLVFACSVPLQCIREKMDVIDLEDEEIDAEVLNSMAVTQVCGVIDFSAKGINGVLLFVCWLCSLRRTIGPWRS